MAPLAWNGMVFVGNAGGDSYGVTGHVYALDARDALRTRRQPAPGYMPELRPGDDLFTNSVIGLDAKTGEMVGYIQLVKPDFHDWDVDAGPTS